MNFAKRQVHLDFHTSEWIDGIGERFDASDFQQRLKEANVDSVTLFAKCHHSWCYYPSKVGKMHPHLKFDLLGAQMNAAHEIGVRAPVYVPAGWSENDANEHPEWRSKRFGEENYADSNYGPPEHKPDDVRPECAWKNLCLNGPYGEYLIALTQEICDRYSVIDGLFFDIWLMDKECVCDSCKRRMKEKGLDPRNLEDARKYFTEKRLELMRRLNEIVLKKNPHATVFYNGAAEKYLPQYHKMMTHYELEDLPTAWGGYDKLPLRVSFFNRTGKPVIGMTGKFHRSWGEFGGYKNPDALRYECINMLAYGAGCSVGDQLHPDGHMGKETYRLIGQAYRYTEKLEPYCFGTENTAPLGIYHSGNAEADEGAVKILLEAKHDFDVVYEEDDLYRYKIIIIPDCVTLSRGMQKKIGDFLERGGKLVMAGAIAESDRDFFRNYGLNYIGAPQDDVDYLLPTGDLQQKVIAEPILCYSAAHRVQTENGEVYAVLFRPYFKRTYEKFCSHQNTPYFTASAEYPACVKVKNLVYFAHEIFTQYYRYGNYYTKKFIDAVLRENYRPVVAVDGLMSCGRVRFVRQSANKRYVLHLMYGAPVKRGSVEVLEDFPEIRDIGVRLLVQEKIKSIEQPLTGEKLSFCSERGIVSFIVPKMRMHTFYVLNY